MIRAVRPSRWRWGPAVALLGLLLLGWRTHLGMELVIRLDDATRPLAVLPLAPGERFVLHYLHSVDRAPIWEEHSVDARGNIYIEEERFVMFGAGMGHWAGHGSLTRRGPYQVIENIHAPTGDLLLRVGGPEVGHAVLWGGLRMDLSAVAAGRAVLITARPVTLISGLWRCFLRAVSRPHAPGVLNAHATPR